MGKLSVFVSKLEKRKECAIVSWSYDKKKMLPRLLLIKLYMPFHWLCKKKEFFEHSKGAT